MLRQPFLGGPAVQAALKYDCLADSDKSRELKVPALRPTGFSVGPRPELPTEGGQSMNINIEVNLKIRASEGEPEEPRPRFLAFLLHRIASRPALS